MGKVKIKLPYIDARHIAERLQDIIGNYEHTDPKMNKMFACLWTFIYIKLAAKTMIQYSGDKSFTLTIAHAIALELLLHRWIKADQEKERDEMTDYRYNLYRYIATLIDQKTA